MSRIRIILALLSLLLFAIGARSKSSEDSKALNALKKYVKDPNLALNWSTNEGVCEWSGMNCSMEGKVVGIQLSGLSLSGALQMSQFLKLSKLQSLSLSGNNFTISFSHLNSSSAGCSLEFLDLSMNRLESGSFPFTELLSFCKNLKHLNVSRTGLNTSLPSASHNLVSLDLSHNNITGELSASICKPGVRFLDLSENQMAGDVPEDLLSLCNSLQELSLADNHLTGAFPSIDSSSELRKVNISANFFSSLKVHNCSSLESLDASFNNISGTVFSFTCPTLITLNLSDNSFSGQMAGIFDNREISEVLYSLVRFQADHNNFTGAIATVPSSLEVLELSCNSFDTTPSRICPQNASLKSLVVVYNHLAGPVLESVLSCENLEVLVLSMNSISGTIPSNLCKRLPKLQHLALWRNQLQGSIPANLSYCSELVTLDLSMNNLEGSIPHELSRLKNIFVLLLNDNKFTGSIPSSFGNLKNLSTLRLCHNRLQGEIPKELRDCSSLEVFEVSDNFFSGQVPGWLGISQKKNVSVNRTPFLFVYGINQNSYVCKGYQQVYSLKGIRFEEFQKLEFATKCTTFFFLLPSNSQSPFKFISSPEILDYSHNNFSGAIPEELGEMVDSLYTLDLASNSLSGEIPESLGNLRNIEWFDLSLNMLDSRIPGSFSRLTFLGKFNVSYNNLYGPIPQSGQLQAFPRGSFEGNPRLCGLPLDSCSNTSASHSTGEDAGNNGEHKEVLVALVSGAISCIIWSTIAFYWRGWRMFLRI